MFGKYNIKSGDFLLAQRSLETTLNWELMFVIFSIAMVGLTLNVTRENIQARNELVFFRIVAVALILLIIFRFSNITAYLPLVAAVFAILSAYTFTLLKNLFYSIVFIALCVLTFSFGCFHFFI